MGGSQFGTVNPSNPTYYMFQGTLEPDLITGEIDVKNTFRTAGTLTKLWARVITGNTSGSSTVTLRQNTANATNTFSIAQGATGAFSDTTPHNDTINGGDLIDIAVTAGSSELVFSIMAATYTTSSSTLSKVGAIWNTGFPGGNNTIFIIPIGSNGGSATEAPTKLRMRKSFTSQNATFNVGINSTSSAVIVASRKNGANGNISISCTAGTTGLFEDDTAGHSDSLALGDDYDFFFTTPATGTFNPNWISIELTSSNNDICFAASSDIGQQFSTSSTSNIPLCGELFVPGTETSSQVTVNNAYIFSQLGCNVLSPNGITAASTVKLRANAGNSGPSVSITASTAGLFFDNSNTYTSSSTDAMNYQLITGSTGTNMTILFITVNLNNQAGGGGGGAGPNYQHFGTNSAIVGAQYYQSFGSQMVVFGY